MHQGESGEIDKKILDLDSKIEMSIDGEYAIPKDLKKKLSGSNFDMLMSKLDALLQGKKEDYPQ